jgi:hypothetical protein
MHKSCRKFGHPPTVESKNALPKTAPPMVAPRLPTTGVSLERQKLFISGLEKMRSRTGLDSGRAKTIDEMMLDSVFLDLNSVEHSPAAETNEISRPPSSSDIQEGFFRPPKSFASSSNSSGAEDSDREEARTKPRFDKARCLKGNTAGAPRDATKKENWRLIRKFLTRRQFSLPKKGLFAALLSYPRNRDILTRPGVEFVANQRKKVRLLIVHMTGEEAPVPCDSCALHRGPFKSCVTVSQKAAGQITNGAICCTNCASKRSLQQKCNVEGFTGKPAAVQTRKQPKGGPVSVLKEQPSVDDTRSQVTRVDNQFLFTVCAIPAGGSFDLAAEASSLRLCSVAMGKVMVDLEGNRSFLLGTHGMFKVMPGKSVTIINGAQAEAVLHVSALKS